MNVKLNNEQLKKAQHIQNGGVYLRNGGSGTYSAFGNVIPGRDFARLLGTSGHLSTKQDFDFDFGYKTSVEFEDLYDLYKRNGVAKAVVNKTALKTWETNPQLVVEKDDPEETPEEREIRKRFQKIRFWQMLQETDKRSLVGEYSGVIFQLADNKPFYAPVERVPGGLNGLVNLIPAWEGQLEISEWNEDKNSPKYGEPEMMTFTESSVDSEQGKTRSFQVHPDRVYIWSQDRTTFNDSDMEATYNAFVDMVKIRGSGGEGFWKNAKSQPILEADKDLNFSQLAQMLGVEMDGLADALDEVVADWNKGFDQTMLLQGIVAKTLGVTLPQPKEFYDIAAREVGAAWNIPEKILFGNQTGERASTEDAAQWNRFNMARRNNYVIPNIMDVVDRLVEYKILPERDWELDWEDLTGATNEEKFREADTMATINQKSAATGEVVFSDDEIRARVDMKPRKDDELSEIEEEDEGDEA